MYFRALISTLLLLFLGWGIVFAQTDFQGWLKKKEHIEIQTKLLLQMWGSYSTGQELFNQETRQYEPVDDRLSLQFRRARVQLKSEVYDRLKFQLSVAYDLAGRDALGGEFGGVNGGARPNLDLWDAFLTWKMKTNSELLYLTAGFFRPQFSRESITSAWSVNSMEKSMTQNYTRRFLVGYGPGAGYGINLGGLFINRTENQALTYNLGVFFPNYMAFDNTSAGVQFAPLGVAKVEYSIGDPEQKKYKLSRDVNYYSQRKGITLGAAASYQGETDLFKASYATELDLLFNWGPLNLDGDWTFFWREGTQDLPDSQIRDFTYTSQTGHVRMGYNIILNDKYFLEPAFMIMQFNGAEGLLEQADAKSVGFYSGKDHTYDVGINWYLDQRNLKLLLHYTWRKGDAGEAPAGNTTNFYYNQGGVGPIQRGNWLGFGINAIL